MANGDDFHDLIRRVRAGDEDAASRLVKQFEPFIRRVIRFRMKQQGDRLRPELDSADVCQSVFKSLFEGLKEGRFELVRSDDLLKLLRGIIRLKIATKARKMSVTLREVLNGDVHDNRVDPRPGPEKSVDDDDLSEVILQQFTDDELEILNRRLDDQPWDAIAQAMGASSEALRKRLARACERVRDHPVIQELREA
jgi:RNA polymerase sigma factor (sigma-70 family)